MNLGFNLKKIIFSSGKIDNVPVPIFKDEKLNETYLPSSLVDSDDDYLADQFIGILDHYEDYLGELSAWDSGEGVWYAYFDKNGNITIADDDDDSPEEDLLPLITLSIPEYKALLLDYRKQAQEFRDKLPQMQKEENRRRANASYDNNEGDE